MDVPISGSAAACASRPRRCVSAHGRTSPARTTQRGPPLCERRSRRDRRVPTLPASAIDAQPARSAPPPAVGEALPDSSWGTWTRWPCTGCALNASEVADRAKAGFGEIRLQGRSGNTLSELQTEPFVGPNGTSGTFFSAGSGQSMDGVIERRPLFQFRAYLTAENGELCPEVAGRDGRRIQLSNHTERRPLGDSLPRQPA